MNRNERARAKPPWRLPFVLLAVTLVLPGLATAEEVDRIVAVVGSEIILLSELDEEIYLAHLREQIDLDDPAAVEAYRREVLAAAVDGKLLLEEARRKGLRASREEVERAVDGMVKDVRDRFATTVEFERQLEAEGSSEEELREGYRGRIKEQLLVRQLVDRRVRSRVKIEERDITKYWEAHRAEIPTVPALLSLRRIVISVTATSGADSAAVARANIVRARIEDGEDFATLARVFSEGPAASRGGDLGWFRPDDLEPVLGDAVADAPDGTVTPVLVTGRGAHILRVSGTREGGERRLSQVVFLRDLDAARANARVRAEAIRKRLLDGEDFAELARTESDDPVTRDRGGDLGAVPLEALEPRYRDALEDLKPGQLSEILEEEGGFAIIRLDGREGERAPTFEEMRERIVAVLEQEKGKTFYDELLEAARSSTYVELRLDPES